VKLCLSAEGNIGWTALYDVGLCVGCQEVRNVCIQDLVAFIISIGSFRSLGL